jgi:hypothetical protein
MKSLNGENVSPENDILPLNGFTELGLNKLSPSCHKITTSYQCKDLLDFALYLLFKAGI